MPEVKELGTHLYNSLKNRPAQSPTKPGKNGYAYTAVEQLVLSTLKRMGTTSTKELITEVVSEYGMHAKEVEDVLAGLRVGKHVLTTRLGRGILNRIAE